MNEGEHRAAPRGKKKRKSVLVQAKKYGKKGLYGRGSDLPEETFQYLVRVLELSRNTFDNDEEKEIFANNSVNQMEGEEISYSCNQLGSRVIENLLPLVNDEILEKFINVFSEDLRPLCMDRFASHVLQKIIRTAADRSAKYTKSEDNPEQVAKFDEWVLKCGNFVLNNLEDFVWDTYANHVVRTCLECLGGFSEGETAGRSKKWGATQVKAKEEADTSTDKLAGKRVVPDDFKTVIKETSRRLLLWPQFAELPYNDLTSGLLQTLLYAIKPVSKSATRELVKKLLDECFKYREPVMDGEEKEDEKKNTAVDSSSLPDVFINETASRVLDVAISVAKPKQFTQIYADCFLNNLGRLSQMSIANHQVQKLFQHCSDKTEFESMYDEISVSLEDILRRKNTGVILSLAQACKRLSTKQQYFQQQLMKVLHCFEPVERQLQFAPLVAKLIPYEEREANKDDPFINVHGSVTLQTLLYFNKPIIVVNSILAMSVDELVIMFSDPKGSHVADAFVSSPSIGEKSREKMYKKLQGSLVKLACSKHGSRSMDALWGAMSLEQRTHVMKELAPKEAILKAQQFGKILSEKYGLGSFKHNPEAWKDVQGTTNRKRKLFEDIIGSVKKK